MLRVDGADELKAAALLYARAPQTIQRDIQAQAKAWAPTLVRAARAHARDRMSSRIADSGVARVNQKGVVAVFGAGKMVKVARPYEFGTARPDAWSKGYVGRTPGGRGYPVPRRRTQRQIPPRNEEGRFVYPAMADVTPDLASRWVRAVAQAVTYGK